MKGTDMQQIDIAQRPVVLFDFDGTVADTARAVMTSARKALHARGFSDEEIGDLRRMIGPPLRDSFHDFWGFSREEAEVVADEYRAYFDHLTPEDYPVFPGIRELLDALRARGQRLSIATSRKESGAQEMVAALGLTQFEQVVGMAPEKGRSVKADSIRDALRLMGMAPDDAVMVGDRRHDVEGAHAMGLPCIAIYSGGAVPGEHESAGADCIVHSIAELAQVFGV